MIFEMKALFIFIITLELYLCVINVKDTENNRTVATFPDASSQFGNDFVDGTVAYLIESHPILACNDTIEPPPIFLPNSTNIIFVSLIRRGICTFEHKVKVAQNSGYQGVIIYNNNSDSYFPMPLPDYTRDAIHIPSRMVGLTSGYQLRSFTFTMLRQQFLVVFYNDFEFNPQYYIIAFLGFVSLGFIIIGIGFAIKLCRDWVKRRANRLKKCHLKKIPIKKFVKGQDTFDICAICLDDFVDGDKLRILPCNHAYHMKCIDPWLLRQKRNCPVCKSRIKILGRNEESDDSSSITTHSDATTNVMDEHTPLINSRDVGTLSTYSSNDNGEIGVTVMPEHSKITVQNCYENPFIDSSEANTRNEDLTEVVLVTRINDYEIVVEPTPTNDTNIVHQTTDLIEIV